MLSGGVLLRAEVVVRRVMPRRDFGWSNGSDWRANERGYSDRSFALPGWWRLDRNRCRGSQEVEENLHGLRWCLERFLAQVGWHKQTRDLVKLFFRRAHHAAQEPSLRGSLQRIPQFLQRLSRVVLLSNYPYDRIHLRIWRALAALSQSEA